MARVLITGGAGFIGSHLSRSCVARGDSVHVIARPGGELSRLADIRDRLSVYRVDIFDAAGLAACFDEAAPEHVFHLASEVRSATDVSFVEAAAGVSRKLSELATLLSVLEGARSQPHVLIRAGSIAEYGPGPAPFLESQRETPTTLYAVAKLTGTNFVRMLQPRLSFPVVTARLALIYGPGQDESFLVPELIRNCLLGRPTKLQRPKDRRDLLYVDDAVAALLMMADTVPADTRLMNVATGEAPAMEEVARLIAEISGAAPDLLEAEKQTVLPDAVELRASPELFRELSGWQARTPLPAGLARTIDWFRKTMDLVP